MNDLNDYTSLIGENWPLWLEEWKDFLRFPSVSSDPAQADACRQCAEWLIRRLQGSGFKTELIPDETGHPLVWGEAQVRSDGPTVLIYGHYDVQPVDPIEEWTSPPFEGTVRNGRLYGRGAQDNKGQLSYVLKAVQSLVEKGDLQINLKILIEGEEESGSRALARALPGLRARLKSDILLVCDTATPARDLGAITMSLRGIVPLEIRVSGPVTDLHSGVHGGVAPNPAFALIQALASMYDSDGRVAIAGFYDGVEEATDDVLALVGSYPIEEDMYRELTGVPPSAGETQYPPEVRRGLRPAIEVNGFHSGYGGPGMKTIIPRDAVAKVSVRTVRGQDPQTIAGLLRSHISREIQNGLQVSFEGDAGGGAIMVDPSSAAIEAARVALLASGVRKVVYLYEGASVPIVAGLAEAASAAPVLVGFGLPDDRFHAPDESFDLEQWRKGFLFCVTFLRQLANFRP